MTYIERIAGINQSLINIDENTKDLALILDKILDLDDEIADLMDLLKKIGYLIAEDFLYKRPDLEPEIKKDLFAPFV